MIRHISILGFLMLFGLATPGFAQVPAKPKPYCLPATDIKQRIIWDAKCLEPEGQGLAFGGQDPDSSGHAGTRILVKGIWELLPKGIEKDDGFDELRKYVDDLRQESMKNLVKAPRRAYFQGNGKPAEIQSMSDAIALLAKLMADHANDLKGPELFRLRLKQAQDLLNRFPHPLDRAFAHADFVHADEFSRLLNETHDLLDREPPARALTAIAYDPKSHIYIMFGGDHLDYLTNDTWVFDMAAKKWTQRTPSSAPPPRANHKLIANGDGTITLKGGYTYSNNTDYVGGPFIDLADGDWTYDIAKNEWKGEAKAASTNTRVYRSGPFHPSFFLQDPKPDPKAFAAWLDNLPANEWKKANPPHLPQMNRDWGTAVLDPDHDMILRYAGGHSAHGGTDVLHYHLASNRWELPFPVEFPLGQTYSNTEYPDGFNFNRRPWITGHTYQNYAYDSSRKRMVFTGRPQYSYLYDPIAGDWTGTRELKPKGMSNDSCFYTLTLTPTPHGVVCWTSEGKLFRCDNTTHEWIDEKLAGEKLPGSVVDNSTLVYDSQRDRLLFFRKGYGDKNSYDGQILELDWKTKNVRSLGPEGMQAASAIPYLCQIRYDSANDLCFVGATLPPDEAGIRRTPAFDCEKNRWVSLKITGDDPSGKAGRNVSLGLVYDAKRNRWWAVDAKSQVFTMRIDLKKADLQPPQPTP